MSSTPLVVTHSCSLFRDGLRQTFTRSRFRPVRLLSSVNEDVEKDLQSADDCVWLLGVDKFEATNEQLLRQITTSNHLVRAVILAASQVASDIVRALNAGACGFFRQDITGDQLLKSLELIMTGQTVIHPQFWMTVSQEKARHDCVTDGANGAKSVAPATCERVAGEDPSCESLPGAGLARGLSSRELAILRTLTEGASNKVIALKLVITESTVKVHMKAILRKLRLQNRTQAAIWAREQRLHDPSQLSRLVVGCPPRTMEKL
jgi:two-component system, NarL family, nitrate/nitrite response regulator NarL